MRDTQQIPRTQLWPNESFGEYLRRHVEDGVVDLNGVPVVWTPSRNIPGLIISPCLLDPFS